MKTKLLLISCAISASALGQISITHAAYSTMKHNGTLDVTKNYIFTDAVAPTGPLVKYHGPNQTQRAASSICSCMVPLDSTFNYVPFVSYSGDPTTTVYGMDSRNDDASSTPIILPFTFDFYGTPYTMLYINNNGNISFDNYYSQFTANPFPDPTYRMIAPFWGDVDTRNPGMGGSDTSGVVYYKITPTAMIVKWDRVGYYSGHTDKQNTFQLIITDGTDPLLPPGKNVGYCYGDMQWTTGDVTGSGGFGSPATVGVNQGNTMDYFQVGTFSYPSPMFDGPYNSPDGVYWLNNQGMYFDVATPGNIPPVIINNNICDTIDVFTGDTTRIYNLDSVQFSIGVSTPEISQTVTAAFTCTEPGAFSYVETMNTATYKQYLCTFIARDLPAGLHYIYVTATDDGTPVATANTTIVIRSNYDPGLATGISESSKATEVSIYPNPANDQITVKHSYTLSSEPVLSISDVVGKTVLKTVLNANQQTIDISSLPQGVYFATITGKEGISKTMKIVKK
ncbi:MAG: hypothetical protein JWP12_3349 [Bacteroidetes bacterium]|nr:hypothetical protein [Bacteroidota bacterium]